MIDPLISLAFSVYSNPGVYGLLLGSGLSRSAGIPTGWEIVLDLIRKIAMLEGTPPEPNPEEWYRSTYGAEPAYGDLLDRLVRSPAERSHALRSYFEPTEEDREHGAKVPTAAHRAVAELVKAGYIKVILTTNFDRLLEIALADVGVHPTVLSSADAVEGALPMTHTRSLLIKINGDYLDTRIKNTEEELNQYDPVLETVLDRLFDEFGLIVCGWSGEWDIALRNAIERCRTRRFTTYWAALGEPSEKAKDLIQRRNAVIVPIDGADSFFQKLKEKILSLAQFNQAHPLSAKIAATQVKRYIVRAEDRILLHDLVYDETERAYGGLDPQRFHSGNAGDNALELRSRLEAYNSITEIPLAIIIPGCLWGQNDHANLWEGMLRRFADPPGSQAGLVAWICFRRYPASLLMYAAGIAAIAGRQFGNLAVALKTSVKSALDNASGLTAERLNVASVMPDNLEKLIPGKERNRTGFSDLLFETLREPFRSFVPVENEYVNTFNLFEYFLALIAWRKQPGWAPIGRARWQSRQLFTENGPTSPSGEIVHAAASALFDFGVDEYEATKREYDAWVLQMTPGWSFH